MLLHVKEVNNSSSPRSNRSPEQRQLAKGKSASINLIYCIEMDAVIWFLLTAKLFITVYI